MLLTIYDLKQLLATLEDARRLALPGHEIHCTEPRRGEDGETFRWEPKPALRAGATAGDGSPVEEMPDGGPGLRIPLGSHGRAFFAIDPETGEVRCAACQEVKRAS